jgi:hypothetical protein
MRTWEQKGMRVSARKKIPVTNGYGFTTQPDGCLVGDITVEIDVDAIVAQLGAKALKSKTHCVVAMCGLVKVKARNIEHKPEESA